MRLSIAARNAASVLPEPVGAAIRTFRPSWISGHARACGSVGAAKWLRNQRSTAGWNEAVFFTEDKAYERLPLHKIRDNRKSASTHRMRKSVRPESPAMHAFNGLAFPRIDNVAATPFRSHGAI